MAHRFIQGFRIGKRLAHRAMLQATGHRMPVVPLGLLFAVAERDVPLAERMAVRLGLAAFLAALATVPVGLVGLLLLVMQ